MRRIDAFLACASLWLAWPAVAVEPALRYRAPIVVQHSAAYVLLPLPASVYGRSLQPGLQDLRVVDARGERVPFALLVPRAQKSQDLELARDATLYPLPPKLASGVWPSPIEVEVQGERIRLRRSGGAPASVAASGSPGWLIDLGERAPGDPPPRSLRLSWSGPAEFSAPYEIETSDDLRHWRGGGAGQLMALRTFVAAGAPVPAMSTADVDRASPSLSSSPSTSPSVGAKTAALAQPSVPLATGAGRFIRLVWSDPAGAPVLTGARVVAVRPQKVAQDEPTELLFSASPEPAGKLPLDASARRSLHFDLGGALPLLQLDLRFAPGTLVVPARVQGRSALDQPWRELAQSVFYRLERGAAASHSPPLELQATARYLRVVPDDRAPALDAGTTRLVVQAGLARLVFAAQGQGPYTLLAGAREAAPGALPATTLVPALEDERARFGRATLGEWNEVDEVARRAESERRIAELRPWMLWAVLLVGVAGLGLAVWRLARRRDEH